MTEQRPTLSLHQKQEQRLNAQQIQSAALLQMTSQELLAHVDALLLENPFLEQKTPGETEAARLLRESAAYGGGDAPFFGGRNDPEMESLAAFVTDQLSRMHLSPTVLRCATAMAALLDEDGYLPREERMLLQERFPSSIRQKALQALQSAEPAGVGAADLGECLALQLRREYPAEQTALAIVAGHLDRLGQRQYRAIARSVGVTEAEVRRCAELIASLEPRPGAEFAPEETTVFIRPDVYILPGENGELQVALGEDCLPALGLCAEYTALLHTTDDPETAAYLREKQRQAKQLLGGISQRGKTLRRCAELIAGRQRDFLLGQSRELAAMSGQELARTLRLHPATVSRALHGKYIQCLQGVYPMTYFCSRPSPTEGVSQQAAMARIAALIAGEEKTHPLSDPKLQALLHEQGVLLSRRTVTKYRLALGIGSASQRRR